MPIPTHCPNRTCKAHSTPPSRWLRPFGSYKTHAHGTVRRFRCRYCGTTCSTQTESMHYAAKLHLPLRAIVDSLLEGASQREIARRYHTSPMAIHNAIIRLGRQAIAAQTVLLSYLSPNGPSVVDTDQHRGYRRIVQRSPVYNYLRTANLAEHRTTSSRAARTAQNPLFPVNYVDRLIRHRLREHTRETIAFARHTAMQLYRMWIFAWDMNTRRVDVRGCDLPLSLEEAWRAEVVSPPVRWTIGQTGTTIRVPKYTVRDLARAG